MSRVFDLIRMAQAAEGSPGEKHVLLTIAIAANEHGVCWPTQATIAERTGLSVRTVRDAVAYWVEQGYLESRPEFTTHVKYGSRRVANVYTLTDPMSPIERGQEPEPEVANRQSLPHGQPAVTAGPNRHSVPGQGTTKEGTTREQRKTSSSRRRLAAAAEDEAAGDLTKDSRLAELYDKPEPEEPQPPGRRRNPDSTSVLSHYFKERVFGRGGKVAAIRLDIVGKYMTEWKRRGVPPDVIRAMVDAFVGDPRLMKAPSPWKTFIANAETLQGKAERALGVAARAAGENTYDEISPELLAMLEEDD